MLSPCCLLRTFCRRNFVPLNKLGNVIWVEQVPTSGGSNVRELFVPNPSPDGGACCYKDLRYLFSCKFCLQVKPFRQCMISLPQQCRKLLTVTKCMIIFY